MADKDAWDHLIKAAEEICASSKTRGVDTRSALAGGALGLLLSSRNGRSLLGKVIKYGTVAGLGALAWQARQRDRRYDAAARRETMDTEGGFATSEDTSRVTPGHRPEPGPGPGPGSDPDQPPSP